MSVILLGEIILLIGLLGGSFIFDFKRKRFDVFETKNVFLFFYGLYVLVPLTSILLFHTFGIGKDTFFIISFFQEPLDRATLTAGFLTLLGIVAFYFGYALFPSRGVLPFRFPRVFEKISYKKVFFFTLLFGLISIIMLGFLITRIGGVSELFGGYRARPLFIAQGLLSISMPWIATSALLFLLVATKSDLGAVKLRSFIPWLFAAIFAFLFIGLSLAIAERRALSIFFVTALVFVHYTIRRFSLRQMIVIAIVLFIALNIFGVVRNWDYFVAQRTVTFAPEFFFYTLSRGEFQSPFVAMLKIVRAVPHDIPYQYGTTFLHAPLHLIPRFIISERPKSASDMYHEYFFPQAKKGGVGYGFFFLAEPYLNFGILGVLGVMMIVGWAFRGLCRLVRDSGTDNIGMLIYAAIVGFTVSFVRSDFVSLVEFGKIFLIPALFILFVSRNFKKNPS